MNKEKIADLEFCEEVISRTVESWRECGIALGRIEEEELWQLAKQPNGERYRNFGHYCRLKWAISQVDARRKIDAAVAASALDPSGELFRSEREVRGFARDRFGGDPTSARLRQEIDRMSPAQLVEAREATEKRLLDPARGEQLERDERDAKTARAIRWLRQVFRGDAEVMGMLERIEHKAFLTVPHRASS